MSEAVIRVEGLGKHFVLGRAAEPYSTFREAITRRLPWNRSAPSRATHSGPTEIWALRDVTFDVKSGEVLGVIGHNGAGKSTLLRILTRITDPTEGRAEILGRVGSLLEVGTGFHPELSGRENIYLNGAILGMTRKEINSRFDEIVQFAEVEDFMDTPVKRYSTGMHLRLAFSVAAHLDPEILLVDEVLAVGDVSFQRKCVGKMGTVSRSGRTILFVSHNLAAVSSLCHRTIVLFKGRVVFEGPTEQAIQVYLDRQSDVADPDLAARTDRRGSGRFRFQAAWLEDESGCKTALTQCGRSVTVAVSYRSLDGRPLTNLDVTIDMRGSLDEPIAMMGRQYACGEWLTAPANGVIRCTIDRLPLMPSLYRLSLCGRANDVIADRVMNALSLEVTSGDYYGTGRLPVAGYGQFLLDQEWSLEESPP